MKTNSPNKVAIIMGSKSDYPVMKECEQILKKFGIKHNLLIVSAHRTPDRLLNLQKMPIKITPLFVQEQDAQPT